MNCALIGLGMVADTHVSALQASSSVSLAGVTGRDRAKTEAFATRHGGLTVFKSLQDALLSDAVDFLIIATPPDARAEIAQAAIDAGKPVLMEKPIERSFAAARDIVALFDAANLPLGIVLQHRARQASHALKMAIYAGTLGNLVSVDLQVPWWRAQSYYDAPGRGSYERDGGGVMITQAIHTLDLALWLAGPVRALQAMMRTTPLHDLEAEDWAGALLEFENGAVGSITATTSAYPGSAEIVRLQGTKAAATLAEGVLTINHLDGRVETQGAIAGTGGGADPMAFTHDWHQTIIEDFAQSLQRGIEPLASGQDALHAHAVINAMEIASKSGTRTEVPKI